MTAIQSILSGFIALLTFLNSLITGFGYEVKYYYYEDIYYGTHERQCFDIAIPADCDENVGLVVYIHGGSWIHRDKSSKRNQAKSVAESHGLVGATINYRYASDDVDCFDMLDDIDGALAEIKAFCSKKGINVDKVILTGNSAGGHLSLLYSYSRADTAPIQPAAVITYCAPTALYLDDLCFNTSLGTDRRMAKLLTDVCGERFTPGTKFVAEEALHRVSPIDYVTPYTVPTLFAHGANDPAIDFEHAALLEQKLSENGVTNELVIYPDSGHQLKENPEVAALMKKKVSQWFDTYLKP